MSVYIYPNKEALQNKYLEMYGREFLELNNLKIGDEIELEFPYEGTGRNYNSKEQVKYTYKKKAKGVLKITENGMLYAESYDDMQFFHWVDNGLSGRSKRSWYKPVPRKSIIEFGTGFIFSKKY